MDSIIFGGSGFIGQHLVNHLGSNYLNLDIVSRGINYQYCDVRKEINGGISVSPDSVIYNLSALCTIPKFAEKEYFETNILGAENVCNLARTQNINTIVFTSSIAPYGMRENIVTEESLPMPTNEYGISKLVAEHIHRTWQAEKPDERKLIILRPGIVFGQNEGANFTRLYKSISRGLFFFPGRKDTKKACIYVKDLVRILKKFSNDTSPGVTLYNACYPEPHSIMEICQTISNVTNVKMPRVRIPAVLLKTIASLLYSSGKLFGTKFIGIHPDRVKKLMVSTNVLGRKLNDKFKLNYSLNEALEDWYSDCDNDGLY
jgi:nucleoside-diphosphate-sugar epimerase